MKNIDLHLPQDALDIISELIAAGFTAYTVGGCVRDALMGLPPKDVDICTSATPEEMKRVFSASHVVETGLKHGTLTVMRHHTPYEVTTFRLDGAYTDRRHPDSVRFVTDVREDLARRDFTVNAMAWNPDEGLVDAFHGREDLAAGVLRCVGDPVTRFTEDALRVMRALRFAAVYGFQIDPETDRAARRMAPGLLQVAAERIRVELAKLLCGRYAGRILRAYPDILTLLIPELKPCVGFDQRNPHHLWDVWEHSVRAVENAPATEPLRLAMLLHDIGKPDAFTVDEQGVGHFYGHPKRSAELAEAVCDRLKLDTATRDRVLLLVRHHDEALRPERRAMLRALNRHGEAALRDLIAVRQADAIATGTADPAEVRAACDGLLRALDEALASEACFSLKQLAVNGQDLIRLGLKPGPALGETLNGLLQAVMDGALPNEREALVGAVKAQLSQAQRS